jgi:hypothetical protein
MTSKFAKEVRSVSGSTLLQAELATDNLCNIPPFASPESADADAVNEEEEERSTDTRMMDMKAHTNPITEHPAKMYQQGVCAIK